MQYQRIGFSKSAHKTVYDEAYLGWRFDLVGVGHTIVQAGSDRQRVDYVFGFGIDQVQCVLAISGPEGVDHQIHMVLDQKMLGQLVYQ